MQSDPDRVPNRRRAAARQSAPYPRGQGKVKNGCVFLDSLGGHRLGQRQDPLLQAPAQADLRGGLPILLSQGLQGRILQHTARSQGTPRLHQDAMVPAVGQGLLLLTAGVALHLVHHRRHLRLQQGLQMMGQEVRDPNGPDPPLLVTVRSWPPGLTVDVLQLSNRLAAAGQWMR